MKTKQISIKVTVTLHAEVPEQWNQTQLEEAAANVVYDALEDKRSQLRNIPTYREVFDDYAMPVAWYIDHCEEETDED